MSVDLINHPPHYNSHPSGVESIEVAEELGFNRGNAWKYLMRWEKKGTPEADLNKAAFYCRRESNRLRHGGWLTILTPERTALANRVITLEPPATALPMALVAFTGRYSGATGAADLDEAAEAIESLIRSRAAAAA